MRLNLNGKINSLYVQSLCMMFFRGEKFPEVEENPKGRISVDLSSSDEGIFARATLEYEGEKATAEHFEPLNGTDTADRIGKIATGHAVLSACSQLTGYMPPWGLLTGIRPSVVADELLQNSSAEHAVDILTKRYLVSKDKAELAVEVAKNEALILNKYGDNSCSIYISIPFCPSRCTYCSFVSYTSKRLLDLIPQYLERLKTDISANFSLIRRLGLRVRTVYIGGGTPTILDNGQLKDLLSHIASQTDVSALDEFTLEAGRPDTITYEKFAIAKRYGVTRVSVNPQSLCDRLLESVGRNHTSDEFFKAFEAARKAGIKTVNVDLIAGLPGDDFKTFAYTYDEILKLRPENLTVHTFCVKKSSELLKRDSNVYSLRGGSVGKCVDYSQIKADQAGYIPYYMYRQKNTVGNYENVGFSLPGHEGIYNIYMMEEIHSIFAAGAGAVGKLVDNTTENCNKRDIERLFHQKYPYEYLCEDKNMAFREATLRFYEEHGMLD